MPNPPLPRAISHAAAAAAAALLMSAAAAAQPAQPPPPPPGAAVQPPGAQPPGAAAQPPGAQPPGAQPPGAQPPGAQPPGAQPPGAQPPGAPPAGTPPPGAWQGGPPPGGPPPGAWQGGPPPGGPPPGAWQGGPPPGGPPPGGWHGGPPPGGPPPGGWHGGPPPGGPPPGGWQDQPPAEEPAKEKPELGSVTESGLPLAMRGGLRIEAARLSGEDDEFSFGTLDVVAQFHLSERVFFDARLPLTIGSMGNPMLGARGILRPSDGLWITLGGAAGLPLVGRDDELVMAGAVTQAYWNLHQYAANTLPLQLITGIELHAGEVAIFRAQLEPVLHLTFGSRADDPMELALQYAVEAQFGHTTGAGLRVQGVWLATSGLNDDHQLAMEPFFVLERERLFLRLGVLLPLTDPIGSIFDGADPDPWGVRAATGLHFD